MGNFVQVLLILAVVLGFNLLSLPELLVQAVAACGGGGRRGRKAKVIQKRYFSHKQ